MTYLILWLVVWTLWERHRRRQAERRLRECLRQVSASLEAQTAFTEAVAASLPTAPSERIFFDLNQN